MRYNPAVRALAKSRHWETTEELSYGDIVVPVGFKMDGASIPLGLRWRFPHGGSKFGPAVLHDYLYRTALVSKREADSAFYEAMIINGVEYKDAKMMYLGVKYWGGFSWRKRRGEQLLKCLSETKGTQHGY